MYAALESPAGRRRRRRQDLVASRRSLSVTIASMASGDDKTSRSVTLAQEKAREQRVQRLKKVLEARLGDPLPSVDALMAELGEGAEHPELWEQLGAAATRDGMEAALAEAYKKCASGLRMKRLEPNAQATMLMRAADYFQGVMGDAATAEGFLERVVDLVPSHAEAYARLERRREKLLDAARLLELYAKVAAVPPKPAAVLANQALNRLLQLSPKTPLADRACEQLLVLVPVNPRLLDALDAHVCATKRYVLACALLEGALLDTTAPPPFVLRRRERLLELYMGDAASPESAIAHVEELLKQDPAHAKAVAVAERLLSTPKVASRAAAALRDARRARASG